MKFLIVVVIGLAVCWGVGKFVNIGATAFTLAQVPISWTMLLFVGTVGLVINRVK
jgi:hypothetical protein